MLDFVLLTFHYVKNGFHDYNTSQQCHGSSHVVEHVPCILLIIYLWSFVNKYVS
jgi:hypothetical protein